MARQKFRRGIDSKDEAQPLHLLRDTRTLGDRLADFFRDAYSVAITLSCFAVAGYLLPAVSDVIFIIGVLIFWYNYSQKNTLPYRLPMRAHTKDYNDTKPGDNKPNMSRGITFFGNDIDTDEELWFNNDDMRTHVLIFGSTGSGKTEALVSLAFNSLTQGSGFIYVDGKGDNALFAKVFSMVRAVGREDDMLTINFMTGARDVVGPQMKRLSNTLNPFSSGSSSMLAQLIVGLMDSASGSSDGDMWKGRAISFVEAIMKVLVYARDQDMILLDANTIRNYFLLDKLEAMVMDKVLIRDNQEPASLERAPDVVMEPIKNYLFNLPGYDKSKKGKQVSQVLEQHGFITMQLTRVFSSLADTYGHIIRVRLAEVDVKDVVLNRRILVVLLPALEKAPEELANLGKIIVASLKAMMASGLGDDVEGDYRDVVLRKPTNSPTPFLCILDEYGYYAVPGFAVVPAQARSLGFSAIFAGQDLPAFQKASKEEAASIGANTNIKICMKLEDPADTFEFFMKTAGEAYVTKVDHFQTNSQSMTNTYLDTRSASFEKRSRIDLLDLKEQREGEAHIFFKSVIIRARMFYANPKPAKKMRLSHQLQIEPPKNKTLYDFSNRINHFQVVSKKTQYFENVQNESEDINLIAQSFAENEFLDPINRGVTALLAYHNRSLPRKIEKVEETLAVNELNVFTALRYQPGTENSFITKDFKNFCKEILLPHIAMEQVETIERMFGKSEKHARNIAEEIIKDMRMATHYPPDNVIQPTISDLIASVKEGNAIIRRARAEKSGAS